MTTLRQAHRKKFTSISNQLIQNNDLSLGSRGLMIYLLSLPDDWKIHVNHLVSIFKEGKYTIMKLLTELKEAGYIYHHKEGYKEGWNYYVFEEPVTSEEFKKFLRTIDFSEQFENLNNSEISHYKTLKEKEEKTKEKNQQKITAAVPSLKESIDRILKKWKEEKRDDFVIQGVLQEYYKQPPGSIMKISSWMETVYRRKLECKDIDELVELRKKFVLSRPQNYSIKDKKVKYLSGAIEIDIALNGSEDFWKKHQLDLESYIKNKSKK